MAECPACGSELDFEDEELEEGDVFTCPDCDVGIEVASKYPLHLITAGDDDEDELEDEDDDDDFDDDDVDDDDSYGDNGHFR